MAYEEYSFTRGERHWVFRLTPREDKLMSKMGARLLRVLETTSGFEVPENKVISLSGKKDDLKGVVSRGIDPATGLYLTLSEFMKIMDNEPMVPNTRGELNRILTILGVTY
jgi:hypothetical protein